MSIGFQCRGFAAPQFAVADPAAGLHHAGRVQVGEVDHHPGREAVEVAGPIRFVGQDAAQAQGFHADVDAVADLQVQRRQQARLDPGFARFRTAARFLGGKRGGRAFQLAPERVDLIGGLDARQLNALVGGDDTGKLHHLSVLQAQRLAALNLLRSGR
ncbi:hypothetical protein D3C84_481140 [compost metagenome]